MTSFKETFDEIYYGECLKNMTCLHVNKRKYVTLHSDWEKSLSVTF